jgi:hypothetical protein
MAKAIRKKVQLEERQEAMRHNRENAIYNHDELTKHRAVNDLDRFDMLVNKLTNWQRSKWANAGYPGRRFPYDQIEQFALLKR